jgi:phosphoglycolate phosphatase
VRIKAVTFDFDGTLYDSFRNGLKSIKDLFRELGRPFRKQDESLIRTTIWGIPLRLIVAALFPEESPAKHRRLLARLLEYMDERGRKSPSRLVPGTNTSLKELKKMGLKIAIATNRSAETFYEALLQAKLDVRYVDYILAYNISPVFSQFLRKRKAKPIIEGTPYKKPDPRYLKKLNRFFLMNNIAAHEVVFCGDTLIDAQTAAQGGYNFIPVLTGPQGSTTAWWEAKLAEARIPALAIASSIRDLPLLIKTLQKLPDENPPA